MARILVTGAAGFTGQHLVRSLLARGDDVTALARDAEMALAAAESSDRRVTWRACDLTNPDSVAEVVAHASPEYVVHLAGVSFVGHDDPEAFYRVNLFGTLNLLAALIQLDELPQKTIIASSANVYGANAVQLVDESVCPLPVNHYASSKLAMEHMVRTWFERLPLIITRPFNYTGRGQSLDFVIPKIVDHFRRHAARIQLGNTEVSRDFSDVRDVVQAYVHLLECPSHSEIVNICTGKALPLRSVLDALCDLTGHAIEVEVDPELVRTNDVDWLAGDNARLRSLTGFTPTTPLLETLRWMIADQSDP